MSSLKIPIRILIASLFLLLVATSPIAAREALLEPLPVGAKARLGRGTVENIQYSPDGTRLAVGGSAGIWLYDTRSHDVVFLLTAPTWTDSLAFSPDGQTLATGEWNTVHLWDASTGILQHTLQGAQGGYVWTVAFSPDGRTLASVEVGNNLRLWDVTTGTLQYSFKHGEKGVQSVAFSPDSRTLASAGFDGTVLLWDVTAGTLRHTLEHADYETLMAFSPDGQTLATGDRHNTIRLWNPTTGTLQHTMRGHENRLTSLAFSPDSRTLVSGGYRTIRHWDTATGTLRHVLRSSGRILAFSPDGQTLASGGPGHTIRLWDSATGMLRHTLDHVYEFRSMVFSPDGRILASIDGNTAVRLWDTATGISQYLSAQPTWEGNNITYTWEGNNITYSPNGDILASTRHRYIDLWDTATGTLQHTLDHFNEVRSLAFSPDGRTLASGDRGDSIQLWDTTTGTPLHGLAGHMGQWGKVTGVLSLSFSPDGRTLTSGGAWGVHEKHTIFVWDVATGARLDSRQGHTGHLREAAFSPNGRLLAGAGENDDTLRLWDVATGTLQHTLEAHTDRVQSVAFSSDGRTLASAGKDNTIRLWDAATGTLRHTLLGHAANRWYSYSNPSGGSRAFTASVAFGQDDRTLASGGEDRTIRLWDATTGTLLQVLQGHAAGIISLVFSPDGRTLASGSLDGTILLWDVAAEMGAPAASGDFRNLETNPDGYWVAWKRGTTVTISFSSPRASVQSHARQDPQPQFVLPEGFRPTTRVTRTVTGQRVDEDRVPVPNAPPATFDLTIGPAGEVRYVDNTKLDGLGYVDYRVVLLTFETSHTPSTIRTGETATAGPELSQ